MKRKLLLIITLLIVFISISNVNAAEICSMSRFNDLKSKATKIKTEWELKFDNDGEYYFLVSISNVDKDLMLKFNQIYYEPVDGEISLDIKLGGGNTYDLQFYGGYDHYCVEQYIYTKKISLPKYNKYSKMKECETYSEWEVCDEWYKGSIIDEKDFYNQLEIYKSKIRSGEVVLKKNNSINPLFIVAGISIIIIISGYVFFNLKNNNKKMKKTKKVGVKNEKD